jgi:hypothetical protein
MFALTIFYTLWTKTFRMRVNSCYVEGVAFTMCVDTLDGLDLNKNESCFILL